MLAASLGRPYDPRRVATPREFLRSVIGPHVLFAFLVLRPRGLLGRAGETAMPQKA